MTENDNIKIQTHEDLFKYLLQDIFCAEHTILKALSQMASVATNTNLKDTIEENLTETKNQIKRLNKIFDLLGYSKKQVKCDALKGLIQENQRLVDSIKIGAVLDMSLISFLQKIQHYEIACYSALSTISRKFNYNQVYDFLCEIISEENEMNERFAKLYKSLEGVEMKRGTSF